MRKYLFVLISITLGCILLIFNYFGNFKTKYPDKEFSKESQTFDQNFSNFLNNVDKNIKSVQSDVNGIDKLKDTVFIKDFLFQFMEEDPYLISTVLVSDAYKVGIKKDEKSLVFAIDSTEILDIVRWQRFENKKLISSWLESFEEDISRTLWFDDLKNSTNKIQWFFRINPDNNNKDRINDKLFYAGYSYKTNQATNIILMQFSSVKLLKKLNIDSNFDRFHFLIKTSQDKSLDLNAFQNENDSLHISKLNHFKKFEEINEGTFSFNYKNETYWNSFKRFPKETGVLYYLLTVSNKNLQINGIGIIYRSLNKIAYLLIIVGLILLFAKKRFFYRKSINIKIPPAKEILIEDENRYLEFKSSARWDYRQEKTNPELEKVILKTLAAFGNTDGGILLIGVDDDKNIIGLEKDFSTLKKSTADYYEIHLRNILHQMMGVKYVSQHIRMQFETCDNQNIICIIKVLAADEALYLKFKNKNGQVEEKFFVRSGNSSQEIDSIAEINDYINTRFKK